MIEEEIIISEETRKRLKQDYMVMSNNELLYEFYQPDCDGCRKHRKKHKELPDYCDYCGVYRIGSSPLVLELKRRGLI